MDATYLDDGKKNIMSVLYSNQSIPSFPDDSNIDPYDVTTNNGINYNMDKNTEAIKILISSGS